MSFMMRMMGIRILRMYKGKKLLLNTDYAGLADTHGFI
jgi:hypothetical protein